MLQFQSEEYIFSMNVLGYQYPDTTPLRFNWDANWLAAEITIGKNQKQFTFSDPCLQTSELIELKDFFESMTEDKGLEQDEIGFIEPVLSFEYRKLDDNKFRLKITVALFRKEKDWPFSEKDLEGMDLTFTVDSREIKKAMPVFEEWIKRFPFRNIEDEPSWST